MSQYTIVSFQPVGPHLPTIGKEDNFGPYLDNQIRSQIGTVFYAPKRPEFLCRNNSFKFTVYCVRTVFN